MDALQDEVESLEAILMDDVSITRNQGGVPELIETTIFPMVEDDSDQQYVCVTLQVIPTAGYPDVSPEFKLLKPRGLDDGRIDAMKAACVEKLREMIGCPVVFDLIELIREQLSGSNLPSGQCVICLYGFTEGDEFTKTECFHYLHSYCLSRHFIALRRNYQEEYDKLPAWQRKTAEPFQAACPVCREHIKDDESDSLKCAMPPAELQSAPDFQLTDDLKELQRRMTSLFLHQKSRGAIIDVDAEGGAAVISIETEEELRRRQRRKQSADEQNAKTAAELTAAEDLSESATGEKTSAAETTPPARAAGSSSTNFAPVVQPSNRFANVDPTNNNYQHHNRRHYRGGRRHQQHHHHHHRDRERERERHENHNSSHSTAAATSTAAAAPAAAAGGKQGKGQAAFGGHNR